MNKLLQPENEIDWKKGPPIAAIKKINLPPHDVVVLNNGIKLILINQGTQAVIKLDIIYKGARLLESKKMISKFTTSMMREGTINHKCEQIAEKIDFYGGSLRMASNLDFSYLSLSALTKYFANLLPIVAEIIYEPVFAEEELEKQKKNNIQKLAQDKSKNELLSYRLLTAELFGFDHAYGYNTEVDLINNVDRSDLVDFNQRALGSDNCFIVLAGKFGDTEIKLLSDNLGTIHKATSPIIYTEASSVKPTIVKETTKNELQSSIKLGKRMFNRHHPDYTKFHVLNTIFGGYFGSRLMKVIREDYGYTYNIYSILDYMIYDGYFYISTEVSPDNVNATIKEIKTQMEVLKEKKVTNTELTMVKNYLMGTTLNLIDGPLNTSNLIKSLELDGCLNGKFEESIDEILSITPEVVRQMAQQYLSFEEMTCVIVGA
jgi:zinc protease